jgi:hypothetical protein
VLYSTRGQDGVGVEEQLSTVALYSANGALLQSAPANAPRFLEPLYGARRSYGGSPFWLGI